MCSTAASTTCSCYLYTVKGDTWEENRQECNKTSGRDLVSMETIEEWEFIKNAIQSKSTDVARGEWHIGLYRDKETTGNWTWVSGKPLTIEKWQRNRPDEKSFALIAKNWPPGEPGLFNSVRDTLGRAYICEWACKYDCKKQAILLLVAINSPQERPHLAIEYQPLL